MFRSTVYHRNSILGEAEVHPTNAAAAVGAWIREIRISHFSPSSDRCPPLAVLHTIASDGPCFRLESKSQPSNESPLFSLYAACLQENKTAVVPLGDEELHLVAMSSRKNLVHYSCFWGFTVVPNLYNSCLVLLNLRCLGIVFDLDETLIVANTMRSFEDKIDALQRRINNETDSQRVIGMLAEVKRYQDDKLILKQYIENNQVVENGKVFEVQPENVPLLSDTHQLITRPIIRLPEKKIILTRVNPTIRDTSVLVRLRPAWEELRSYLTARGRKRFEVYVCTMAERDYALEMWRLLDPESCLINSRDLLDRIVCVKSGLKKSLLNVFQDGTCHPKMSLVIDDRLKVWNEKDQPRVHVVPAFAPYYAPQAEANNSIPVLCLARNVACNVRGSFFKEFDEGLLPRITDIFYEDEMIIFPSPDVGNYLTAEDDTSALNGNKDLPCIDGMINVDSEKRLKDANNGVTVQIVPPVVNHFDPNTMSTLQRPMVSSSSAVMLTANPLMMPLPNNQLSQPIAQCRLLGISGFQEPSLQGSPAREEGEVPESELDPDTRRRLLILQHGQDTRDPPPPPPFSVRPPPLQVTVPPVQSESTWFPPDGEMNPRQPRRAPKGPPLEPEDIRFARKRSHNPLFFPSRENFVPSDRVPYDNQPLPRQQGPYRNDRSHLNHALSNSRSFSGEEIPVVRPSSNCRDTQLDFGPTTAHYVGTPPQILLEIAKKCGTKVEFRSSLCDTTELRFHIEAWFVGEKIGDGIGRTRKEAQYQAAEKSLRYLANKYLANSLHDPTAVLGDSNKLSHTKGNGFISDSNSFGYPASIRDDLIPSTSEESRLLDIKPDEFKKPHAPVNALKELCVLKGYNLDFQVQPSPLMSSVGKNEVYVEVEVAGQILGKGVGATREEAKLQAAEEALENFKSMLGQVTQKRSGAIRQFATNPSKRLRQDFSRELSRTPPSGRYPKNETFMS